MKRTVLILVLAHVAGLVVIGWFALRARSSKSDRPNIVLISLDTCRADHLSCYGRFARRTPHIDAFAREGILFSNAISPMPMTLPAHSSMLTGTIPPYHGVHDNLAYRLGEHNVTIAERLRKHGYQTIAVLGAFVLDSKFGLDQGFDTYQDDWEPEIKIAGGHVERRGEQVTRLASDWLDRNSSKPFFLFVHYFDPHHPYRPPAPFNSVFADDLYAGEVAYTDKCVGQLLDKLKTLGLYDSSLVIIAGDHGESLGEHGEELHGYFIYHSTTKVPLIVKLPAGQDSATVLRTTTVDETVSLIDIVPTILGQVGLPIPPDVQGRDLVPLALNKDDGPADGDNPADGDQGRDEGRYIYSESMMATAYGCSSLLGVEAGRWKYIQTTRPELYDLVADPGETNNLAKQRPQEARRLQQRLRTILQETLRPTVGPADGNYPADGKNEAALDMDSETLERLRQLGYTGGPAPTKGHSVEHFEFETQRQDPKDFIGAFRKILSLHHYVKRKDYAKVQELCAENLAEQPDVAYFHGKCARAAANDGRLREAGHHFREALRLDPDSPVWHNDLGALLILEGRLDEALVLFEKALRLVMGDTVAVSGADETANVDRTLTRPRLIASPFFNAHLNMGGVYLRQGKFAEAVEASRQAVQAKPDHAGAHSQLGDALRKLGRLDEAAEAYREALRLAPNHAKARRQLGRITGP